MRIEQFNDVSADEAAALLRSCVEIDSWVHTLLAGRPYGSVDDLLGAAREQSTRWTGAEVEAALADHPRIGERHPGGASAEMSRREQAGVDPEDALLQRRLLKGNRAYEERFGRIFLIRAAGRTSPEILAQLEERLGNSPEEELEVTSGQLAAIALLRLEGQVT